MDNNVLDFLSRLNSELRNDFSYDKYKRSIYAIEVIYEIGIINIYDKIFWISEFGYYNCASRKIKLGKIDVNAECEKHSSIIEYVKNKLITNQQYNMNASAESIITVYSDDNINKVELSVEGNNIIICFFRSDELVNVIRENKLICNSDEDLILFLRKTLMDFMNDILIENEESENNIEEKIYSVADVKLFIEKYEQADNEENKKDILNDFFEFKGGKK